MNTTCAIVAAGIQHLRDAIVAIQPSLADRIDPVMVGFGIRPERLARI